jgi:CheY-like chemotaxis protein
VADRRILLVDDDDAIREMTQMALETVGGWQVVAADSGARCLAMAAEHRPDAILLDVMMPGMDGPTTFVHLQEDESTRSIPVILLTAKVLVGERQLWDDLSISGVIPKPFNPMTLSQEVSSLIGWDD